MPDHRHVTTVTVDTIDAIDGHEVIERGDDAQLGVHGPLPAGGAALRVGEALIGEPFVLVGGHEPGRRAVSSPVSGLTSTVTPMWPPSIVAVSSAFALRWTRRDQCAPPRASSASPPHAFVPAR